MRVSCNAGIGELPALQMLSCAHNSLPTIAGCFATAQPLARLHLACNCLPSLDGIERCPCLLYLDASRNVITSLAPLNGCPLLQARRIASNCWMLVMCL